MPKKHFSLLLTALLIMTAWVHAPARPAAAAQPEHYQSDAADLTRAADIVIAGILEKQDVGISSTIADVRITQVFKGAFQPGQMVRVQVRSGRVMVSEDQPDMIGVRQAVFFLKNPAAPQEPYGFLRDNYGFKPIINDNVYTNPQDPMQTVKLKKYQAALTSAAGPIKPAKPAEGPR
jgi:hypothetical protein